MDGRQETSRLLKAHGATLLRSKSHEVWMLPGGQRFIRAKTPSDVRGERNELARLKRMLGLHDEGRGQAGERRVRTIKGEKRIVRENLAPTNMPTSTLMGDKLRLAGVAESAVREQLEQTQSDLEYAGWELAEAYAELEEARAEIVRIKTTACACFGCNLKTYLRQLWRRLCLLD